LAVRMAQLFGGVGSVQALQTIANQSPAATKPSAVSALAGIADRPSAGSDDAARAATDALVGIFKGQERALVKGVVRGGRLCNGFFAATNGAVGVTPAYCIEPAVSPKDVAIKMWDDQEQPVVRIDRHDAIVALQLPDSITPAKLQLAGSTPPVGA